MIEKHIKLDQKHNCVDKKVTINSKQIKNLRNEVDKIYTIINIRQFS